MVTVLLLLLAGGLMLLLVHTVRVVRADGYGTRPAPSSHHGAWCSEPSACCRR